IECEFPRLLKLSSSSRAAIEPPACEDYGSQRFEDNRFMPRKKFGRNRKNRCRFCTREGCPRPAYVDYKDIGLLKKLCTNQSKMFSRKRSGNCAAFQRASSAAVKRARFMALLPYVGE
ncbi:MAG: 30S ribosomal protein S18, partial [Isosphaeraceae bacterium]